LTLEWSENYNPNYVLNLAGAVTSVASGTDGQPDATYNVDYEGEGLYFIDHLIEDFQNGSVQLI
jgi:hypothetical protein